MLKNLLSQTDDEIEMARSKQTARKSPWGNAPRKQQATGKNHIVIDSKL